MQTVDRDTAIKKIMGMPQEQVAKVLIFMAGMEAEHCINAGIKVRLQKSDSSRQQKEKR